MHIRDFMGRKIHFIGVGGISMSGLAEILLSRGYPVSGSDQTGNPLLERLRALGADVYIGHRAGQQRGAALIVKNAAIGEDNPELAEARAQGVPVMERTELLGQLMEEYRTTVSVCGTHGKTTATSMLTTILELTGRDPTAHIGSVLPLVGGATKAGGKEFFVVEASEYKDDFLALPSTMIVMLNIDADHLDYFRNIEHIEKSFAAFAARLPKDGLLVGNGDDNRVRRVMATCGRRVESFGLEEKNDWRAVEIVMGDRGRAGLHCYAGTSPCRSGCRYPVGTTCSTRRPPSRPPRPAACRRPKPRRPSPHTPGRRGDLSRGAMARRLPLSRLRPPSRRGGGHAGRGPRDGSPPSVVRIPAPYLFSHAGLAGRFRGLLRRRRRSRPPAHLRRPGSRSRRYFLGLAGRGHPGPGGRSGLPPGRGFRGGGGRYPQRGVVGRYGSYAGRRKHRGPFSDDPGIKSLSGPSRPDGYANPAIDKAGDYALRSMSSLSATSATNSPLVGLSCFV